MLNNNLKLIKDDNNANKNYKRLDYIIMQYIVYNITKNILCLSVNLLTKCIMQYRR